MLRFADGMERMEYIDQYCGSVDGWRYCTVARMLELRYEHTHEDGT